MEGNRSSNQEALQLLATLLGVQSTPATADVEQSSARRIITDTTRQTSSTTFQLSAELLGVLQQQQVQQQQQQEERTRQLLESHRPHLTQIAAAATTASKALPTPLTQHTWQGLQLDALLRATQAPPIPAPTTVQVPHFPAMYLVPSSYQGGNPPMTTTMNSFGLQPAIALGLQPALPSLLQFQAATPTTPFSLPRLQVVSTAHPEMFEGVFSQSQQQNNRSRQQDHTASYIISAAAPQVAHSTLTESRPLPPQQKVVTAQELAKIYEAIYPQTMQQDNGRREQVHTTSLSRTAAAGVPLDAKATPTQELSPSSYSVGQPHVASSCSTQQAHFPKVQPGFAAAASLINSGVTEEEPPTLPNQRQESCIRFSKHDPFPVKLYQMMEFSEKSGKDDVISFTPSGNAFKINDPNVFSREILPLFFRHSRIDSFKRQLGLYGFLRISVGPEEGAYEHPLFVRGRPDLCVHVTKKDSATVGSSCKEKKSKIANKSPHQRSKK